MKKNLIIMTVAAMVSMAATAQQKIVIKGSDTVLPLSQKEAESYMKKNSSESITVIGGGSGVGIAGAECLRPRLVERFERRDVRRRTRGERVDGIHEECGEGVPWAIALLTDCYYRLGICHEHLGNAEAALKHFMAYLILRTSNNADSIYTLEEALSRLRQLPGPSNESSARRFDTFSTCAGQLRSGKCVSSV